MLTIVVNFTTTSTNITQFGENLPLDKSVKTVLTIVENLIQTKFLFFYLNGDFWWLRRVVLRRVASRCGVTDPKIRIDEKIVSSNERTRLARTKEGRMNACNRRKLTSRMNCKQSVPLCV